MPQFPANIDLSTLDGLSGFKLSGAAAQDYSGRSPRSSQANLTTYVAISEIVVRRASELNIGFEVTSRALMIYAPAPLKSRRFPRDILNLCVTLVRRSLN